MSISESINPEPDVNEFNPYLQGPYAAASADLDRSDPGIEMTDQVFDEVGRESLG